jgi:F420-non-reducing hydrogenase iron-sulfur subunit
MIPEEEISMEKPEGPKIIAFLCNWCTYAAADLAGTARLTYPPNVRTVRIMCTGSLDPMYVLKAFLEGADGVLVGGCALGDCHYTSGNYKARRKVAILHEVLDAVGIEKSRLWLRWISASESGLYAETIREMTKAISAMGPSQVQARMIL